MRARRTAADCARETEESFETRAEDYLMVGRYAVQFLWSDAHYTGIYPFNVLRAPCQGGD